MWGAPFPSLPTQRNAVRQRARRRLGASGCAALRDGVHRLPVAQADGFERRVQEVCAQGGQARLPALSARDEARRAHLHAGQRALSDRSRALGPWRHEVQALAVVMPSLAAPEAPRARAAARFPSVGGIPAPEAPGPEAVRPGLHEVHADDGALADAAATGFDALHDARPAPA